MAVAPIKLPRLPANEKLINADGTPTLTYSRWWQSVVQQVETAINGILNLPEIQAAVAAAQAAADAANAAAAVANGAADDAAAQATANAREQALINSYIEPVSVLTASTTTITIAGHTRYYADGTSAPVSGGSIAATASGDTDYISYSDPSRTGGAVTYVVSTTQPPQTGDVHVVGAVAIPAAGTNSGGAGPKKPGYVDDVPV